MRERGRRLKKIAFGRSEQGAAKVTRMRIARILNPKSWQEHREERKQIIGKMIVFQGAEVVSYPRPS